MGTRGIFGVRIDGTDKLMYNQFDSYPDALGVDMLNDARTMLSEWGLEKMKERARALKLVNEETPPPTTEEIAMLEDFSNFDVGEQTDTDWYCVLRELQGKIMDTLVVGYGHDGSNFIYDSLFCEWGYIINLDEGLLEVYRGFQNTPHNKGRYADGRNVPGMCDGYYPSALINTFPLDDLPDERGFMVAIHRGDMNDEEAILHIVEEYGEVEIDMARDMFGVNDPESVIKALQAKGHEIEAVY